MKNMDWDDDNDASAESRVIELARKLKDYVDQGKADSQDEVEETFEQLMDAVGDLDSDESDLKDPKFFN